MCYLQSEDDCVASGKLPIVVKDTRILLKNVKT